MKRVVWYVIAAGIFEVLALVFINNPRTMWVVQAIVGLFVLYLLVLAVKGWSRQNHLRFDPVMTGKVVRRKHWHLF